MSYFRRFLWSTIHRPTLRTLFLTFLCVFCFLNIFLHCSGSIRSDSPKIVISSSSASAETESLSSSSSSSSTGISSISPEASSIRDNENDQFFEDKRTYLFPNEQIIVSPTAAASEKEQATEIHSINTKATRSPGLTITKLDQEVGAAEVSAQRMTKVKTAKIEQQKKKIPLNPQFQNSQKNELNEDEETLVQFLKEQDYKLGISNIDLDADLHLTTVENATDENESSKSKRSSSTKPSVPNSGEERPQDYYYDDDDNDNEDDTNGNADEDEIDDEDIIETIVLNNDKPSIHQLPYCKQTGTSTNHGHNPASTDDLVVARRKGFQNGKQLVIATLDGKISFLDQSGKILWSFCTGHFFSSTISSIQLSEHGKLIKLIPSLTGGLYKYDGQSLQAMPLTAESLLRKSFKLAQDVVITGGKEIKTFGVDINSGTVKYECGMNGCKSEMSEEVEITAPGAAENDSKVVLVVKKQLQTVRAIESTTGTERWNFSVATHELAVAGIQEGCHEGAKPLEESEKDHSTITKFFRMVIPEGLIFGADEGNKIVWQHKFDSPISQAWIFENGRLTVIDPIKCAPLMEEAPSLYVGIHKEQLYVQESQSTVKKIKNAFELTNDDYDESVENINQKRIEWKPLTVAIRDENTALSTIHESPFFVYDREEVIYPAIEHNGSSSICDDEESPQGNQADPGDSLLEDAGIMLTISTLLFYWKEVLGISFLTALILLIPVVRLVRNRTARQVIAFFREKLTLPAHLQEQAQENERALMLYQRQNTTSTVVSNATVSTLLSDSSPSLDIIDKTRTRRRTTSSSSNHSFPEDQIVPFVSQYIREFEPIQCLGRGGFGVVFEAKKKIDERNYAVKRIPLPNRAKSRDRVMREVKALAKLDHKNIVRYFNAWIENPPVGWLEKNDPLWDQVVANSPSPTNEYPSEYGLSEESSIFFNNNKLRKDHEAIALSGFTPDKDAKDYNNDDSFIVFAASEEETSDDGDGSETKQLVPQNDSDSNNHVINIPSNNNPDIDNESEVKVDDAWKLSSLENSIYKDDSYEKSKFFVRPTTLDIPSSSSNKSRYSNYSDQFENNNDTPTGIMYLYIQQELCQKRTLQEWLAREKQRDLRQVMKMFIQIVEAVEYIHSNRLIHRDLKPSNVFLSNLNQSPDNKEESQDNIDNMTVKIGDFGLVTTSAVSQDDCDNNAGGGGDTTNNPKLTGLVGTQLYMSYEQTQRKSYNHKVDIYSLGLIFFEMIVPFSTGMERYDHLMKVRKMDIPEFFLKGYPEEYKLIQQMVSHDPEDRPEATEIKFLVTQRLKSLKSESEWLKGVSNWHRSKSTQSADRKFRDRNKMTKILKAHSFV